VITKRHGGSALGGLAVNLRAGLRDNIRIFYILAAAVFVILLTLFGIHAAQIKEVELVVDGQSEFVRTKAKYIDELLEEQGIEISDYDRVSVPLTDLVAQHKQIEIVHAVPVVLEADGRVLELRTTASNVEELLGQANVTLGAFDIVEPGPDSAIHGGERIRITRVEKKFVQQTEIIPYDIVTKEDPTLTRGKEKVLQAGSEGVVQHVFEHIYRDGQLFEQRLVSSRVLQEAVDEIVALGTKNEVMILSASSPDIQTVTKDGLTFGVKKIIEATLTAYDAGIESTGKTEDHPYYGITYTGTKAIEGRTVAVDPKVIPMGWWIYIEGYGFRKAEDIGSAIKGNRVDIYFESHEVAVSFGRKKGKVYIIGPKHPAGEQ